MLSAKEITKKAGVYSVYDRNFIVDQYDSVYEQQRHENRFFCKLNNRTVKQAIADAINAEHYF